jgi:gamma-glutamylcyclotransferase (GGCT)/AIG2-like uncharacterized protein YtfP
MNSQIPYLFVYGTLRTAVNTPAKQQVMEHLELIGETEIRGKLYDMGDYPTAVPDEDGTIRGEILKVNDPEKVFGVLDRYEGSAYERGQIRVTLPDGSEADAWIYWYKLPVEGKTLIKNKSYLDYLNNRDNVY